MDLNAITTIDRPRSRDDFGAFADGDAWLAGGTWLFSEPQPHLRRLIDLSALDWEPLRVSDAGLFVAATCTVATLNAFEAPASWIAAELIDQCCRAFLASFKVLNMATVGGNFCMALPAGPMISLAAALDGVCVIWTPDGGERRLPREALTRRTAFRRISLTPLGLSSALLIGTLSAAGTFALTVTASTRRP